MTTPSEFKFHESTTFMDYLHGDVKDKEAWFACYYEYARESKVLWELAEERDALAKKKKWSSSKAALWILQNRPVDHAASVECLLRCPSFPRKDWNQLTTAQCQAIMRQKNQKALPVPDVCSLKRMGVLAKLEAMAERAKPVVQDVPIGQSAKPVKLVLAMLQSGGPVYQVVHEVDFSKGATRLADEFQQWLNLPHIKRLLNKHRKETAATIRRSHDGLKDLAAWRLYRKMDNDCGKANQFANENRKQFDGKTELPYRPGAPYKIGDPRPFRNARAGNKENKANAADLFGHDEDYRHAKARCQQRLWEWMPTEFLRPRLLKRHLVKKHLVNTKREPIGCPEPAPWPWLDSH